MAKTVFVAHAMSGDIEGNTRKVLSICKALHSKGIVPIFPSLIWRQYLGNTPGDKQLARLVNIEYFRRGIIDEMWIYGISISQGIKDEIKLALENNIPVIAKSVRLKQELIELLSQ